MTTPTTKWTFVPSHDSSLTGNAIPDSWEDEDGNRVWENPTPTTTEGMGEFKHDNPTAPGFKTSKGEVIVSSGVKDGEKSVAVYLNGNEGYSTKFALSQEAAFGLAGLLLRAIGIEDATATLTAERDTAQAQCAGLREALEQWMKLEVTAYAESEMKAVVHNTVLALATDPGNAILSRLKEAEADSARLDWLRWHSTLEIRRSEMDRYQHYFPADNLREAIDAARAKEAE